MSCKCCVSAHKQAERALDKQKEKSNYHLLFHNCCDRAREVLESAGVEAPPKKGGVTTPKSFGKWIDQQNNTSQEEKTE